MKITSFIIIIIISIVVMPFLIIWSLNNLFNLTITYSLTNWVSVFVLGMFLNSNKWKVKSN